MTGRKSIVNRCRLSLEEGTASYTSARRTGRRDCRPVRLMLKEHQRTLKIHAEFGWHFKQSLASTSYRIGIDPDHGRWRLSLDAHLVRLRRNHREFAAPTRKCLAAFGRNAQRPVD